MRTLSSTLRNALAFTIPAIVFLGLSAVPAHASSACPEAIANPSGSIGGTSNTAYETEVTGGANPCNIIITFNLNGSIVTTLGASTPYDGDDDNVIGIVNNSLNTITSVTLSNLGVGIFAFDVPVGGMADGICAYMPFASNAMLCDGKSTATTTLPGAYLGSASSFTGIDPAKDSGTVNFAGIAPGSTGYFSLEAPVALNLQVQGTPEASSMLMVGLGLCFVAFVFRRSQKVKQVIN
jgi:hypothetical protein